MKLLSRGALLAALLGLSLTPCAAAQSAPAPLATDLDQRLETWRERHGSTWDVALHDGRVEMLFGGRAEAERVPETPEDFERQARLHLADSLAVHRIAPETLSTLFVRTLPLATIGSVDKTTVRLQQTVQGVPVVDGWTNVLMGQDGALLSVQTTAIPGELELSVTPTLLPSDARRVAAEALFQRAGVAPTRVSTPELWVDRLRNQESRAAVLVWRVTALWEQNDFAPEGLVVTVDAGTGTVLRTESAIHSCGGDVSGTVLTNASPGSSADTAGNPPTLLPAANIDLRTSTGTVRTDANGNFTVPGAGALSDVEVRYDGEFAVVNNGAGANYELNLGSISGTGNSIILNPSPDEFTTAQANAYVGINDLRDWIRSIVPGDDTADFRAVANTNINNSCNAFFNGSSVNFYRQSGNCNNTSFSTIVAHEMGHWLNVEYGTGNGSDGMGEGNADVFAMYLYDTPIVGDGFTVSGGNIRNGNNTRQFCGDCCGGCYGGVHANGEVWMGAAWKIRTNLKNSLGSTEGGLHADTIFLSWLNAYNASAIRNSISVQWLTLDDDDGVVENGSPNYTEINSGFLAQGFPGFTLRPIAFTNVSNPGDTPDEVGPYRIQSRMEANFDGPLVATTLVYRVDGGPWTNLPMSEYQPNFYEAFIPGQPAISNVEWYVEATDSAALTLDFPSNGTLNPRSFLVGDLRTIFFDNFQNDLGWTVTNEDLSTGEFTRAAPNGTFTNGDPVQPNIDFGGGTRCYFTGPTPAGAGTGDNDVDGGPTRITSPAFDFTNPLGPDYQGVIDYAYWLYNDDQDDPIIVELSNGGPWVEAARHEGFLGGWRENRLVISDHVVPNDSVRIRFSASDNPNNSVTEVAIDDVRIRSTEPPPCVAPTTFCEAEQNSTGFRARMGWSGTPSVSANDLVLLAYELPASTNGIFIYSLAEDSVPLGNGRLCLSQQGIGFILRLPAEMADENGTMAHALDISSPPVPGVGEITAGSTWKFQCWFRDNAAGGSFFNLSDGLSVSFCQ